MGWDFCSLHLDMTWPDWSLSFPVNPGFQSGQESMTWGVYRARGLPKTFCTQRKPGELGRAFKEGKYETKNDKL